MTERTGGKNGRSARGRRESERDRKNERRREITGLIVVREFARQEHYQEKMFRDCALEHDVFGSLVRSPRSPAPEDCPVSSLSTTLSCDHYSAAFLAILVLPFFPLQFQSKRHVGRTKSAAKKISIDVYSRTRRFVYRDCLQRCRKKRSQVQMTTARRYKNPKKYPRC